MKPKPVPLPDGCYADASKSFSDQDVCNYWCEYAEGEGARSPKKLVQLPGLRPYADFGAGPHRAIRNVEGNLFVVADTHAYWVKSATDVTQLGEVPGRGRCWITYNQTGAGAVYQVLFSNGPDAWIYDVGAATWTKITDDAFRGARSPVYANSRFLAIEQQRRYFANSDEGDGLAWDSVETYQAESSPDRLRALIVWGGDVLAFNETTLEFFNPSSSADDIANHIYYTRSAAPVPIGAGSEHGVVLLDGRVFFLGNDGAAYYLSGYSPVRITTPSIEAAWAECDLSKCFAFTYESHGHAVVYFTFPDGQTWGYDCLSSARAGRPVWHRRETIGLDRWRLNTLTKWNGEWYGGSYNSGILYKLDWSYYGQEGCDEIRRYFTTGVLHDEGQRVSLNALRIECDTGYATTTCEAADPVVPAAGGYIAFGLVSYPPNSSMYLAETMAGPFVLTANDLESVAGADNGVAVIDNWVFINRTGNNYIYRSQPPFATWEGVETSEATIGVIKAHGLKVVGRAANKLTVSTDYGATYSDVAFTVLTPAIGFTTINCNDVMQSLDGKLILDGNDNGNASIIYSTTLASWTTVRVAAGQNTNIPTFTYTGTHWVMATGLGQIWRASSIDGPYTMVMDTGDLIDAAYYAQVMRCNDSGLVLLAFAHADTTQKLLVSTDHGATWTDETVTFPGFTNDISVIDNVFYNGWDKTTDGVTWSLKSLSGSDEYARFDGVIHYEP